jgi:hypothetical protein
MEHNMSSRTVLAWPYPDSKDRLCLAVRHPLKRWLERLKVDWKLIAVPFAFWLIYGYACVVWITS